MASPQGRWEEQTARVQNKARDHFNAAHDNYYKSGDDRAKEREVSGSDMVKKHAPGMELRPDGQTRQAVDRQSYSNRLDTEHSREQARAANARKAFERAGRSQVRDLER